MGTPRIPNSWAPNQQLAIRWEHPWVQKGKLQHHNLIGLKFDPYKYESINTKSLNKQFKLDSATFFALEYNPTSPPWNLRKKGTSKIYLKNPQTPISPTPRPYRPKQPNPLATRSWGYVVSVTHPNARSNAKVRCNRSTPRGRAPHRHSTPGRRGFRFSADFWGSDTWLL